MAGPGKPENLAIYRAKRTAKNADKIINNFRKPNNIKKQRLSYMQQKMDEEELDNYVSGLFKMVKDIDDNLPQGTNPLTVIGMNERVKLADTGMKLINLKKQTEIQKDEDSFNIIVKKVEVVSEAFKRNKGQIPKG